MTRPTPESIRDWSPESWLRIAESLRSASSHFHRLAMDTLASVQSLGLDEWSGLGRRACEDAVDNSATAISRTAAALDDAADACTSAASIIAPIREALIAAHNALVNSDFSVAANWAVRDELFGDFGSYEGGGPGAPLPSERRVAAQNETIRLQRLADEAMHADSDAAQRIADLLERAQTSVPVEFGLSAADAARDVDSLLAGTATTEQRDRFLRATSLEPVGEDEGDVVLTKNQMDYIESIVREIDERGIGAYHFWGNDDREVREGLVLALTISSDPRVRTDELIPVAVPFGPGPHSTQVPETNRRADALPSLARAILDLAQSSAADTTETSDNGLNPKSFAIEATSSGVAGALKVEADVLERTGKHALNRESIIAIAPDLRSFGRAIGVVGPAVTAYSGYEEWSSGEASGGEAAAKTTAALAGGAVGGSAAVATLGAISPLYVAPPVLAAVAVGAVAAGVSYGAYTGVDRLWDRFAETEE